jgi:uncharacterized protein YhaN
MWRSSRGSRGREVTCIACGDSVPRSKAREYDKYGDRWDRSDKEFEYLCKPCDRDRCHQPRGDLEAHLEAVEAATDCPDQEAFLAAFLDRAGARDESVEERER